MGENRCFQELKTRKTIQSDTFLEQHGICDMDTVVDALLININDLSLEERKYIRQIKCEINCSQSGWIKLNKEENLRILVTLLYDWLDCLKVPPVGPHCLENIVVLYKQPETCFQKFDLVLHICSIFYEKMLATFLIVGRCLLNRILITFPRKNTTAICRKSNKYFKKIYL